MNDLSPPWSDRLVRALNVWQRIGLWHPYTCGRDHERFPPIVVGESERVLVATVDGWICPEGNCTYTQTWVSEGLAKTAMGLYQAVLDEEAK